jgi:hypothetical protein
MGVGKEEQAISDMERAFLRRLHLHFDTLISIISPKLGTEHVRVP